MYRLLLPAVLACSACNSQATQNQTQEAKPVAANPHAFEDVAASTAPLPADRPLLQVQAVLDRLGFSSRLIDGKAGETFTMALRGFQQANGLNESGELDEATQAALARYKDVAPTRTIRIPAAFAQDRFYPDLPKDAAKQAKLPALGYRDLVEKLAERFHTDPATLIALNAPNTPIAAGAVIRVPNVSEPDLTDAPTERGWDKTLAMLGVSVAQPKADRIVVDKSEAVLRVFDAGGKLIAQFPATMGSKHDPLPIGSWTIKGVARNPDFHYNPRLFWDVSDSKDAQLLPPGPNSPVGVVWMDLSKDHYGIHGTPEPANIGVSESHGCIRLTNWDAARLAQMVSPGIKAVFQR